MCDRHSSLIAVGQDGNFLKFNIMKLGVFGLEWLNFLLRNTVLLIPNYLP